MVGESVGQPWDGFVVGPENALAQAGALALARGEAEGLSPLVIHGASGVGKSRLVRALVAERLVRRPESAVAHLEAEAFAALCAEASARPGGWSELRDRFRRLDLLALDDLHALARAPMARDELTHTLDALADSGGVVAVTARTGPGGLADAGWPSRLVSRLSGGLSVRIDPPAPASRRRYLLEQARRRGLSLTADAVDALAEAADGYRPLDGWLAQLALRSRASRRPIDRGLVQALFESEPPAEAPWTIPRVARLVAARFGVSVRDLRSGSRRRSVVAPRHLAMHLAHAWSGRGFAAIGAYFGGRDPATVRHACRMAQRRLDDDPALAAAVAAMRPQPPPRCADEPVATKHC